MERRRFVEGARVLDRDDNPLGTLERIDTASPPPSLVVRRDDNGQTVRIPLERIDPARSTDRLIVLRDGSTEEGPEPASERVTIPLASEELVPHLHNVAKGRVLVHKRVETTPVAEDIEVEYDEVDVERVAVHRDVDAMPPVRHEGDTMIVPVVEEVLVVEKRLHLVEELRITRRRVTDVETVRDELRREVVEIEEVDNTEAGSVREP
jgi:uncharacterized protein (TIGR02271 family)